MPAAAGAATERFERFEINATASYVIEETCDDGSTATQRVTVIAGHEEETEPDGSTAGSDFATVLIRGFDCDDNLINDRGSGPAKFSFSPSLQTASVTGTIPTRQNHSVTVAIEWTGTGPIETTSNTTRFPGFTGHFKSRSRDAVATGTVAVDGEPYVSGTATTAEIETLEDTNISHP